MLEHEGSLHKGLQGCAFDRELTGNLTGYFAAAAAAAEASIPMQPGPCLSCARGIWLDTPACSWTVTPAAAPFKPRPTVTVPLSPSPPPQAGGLKCWTDALKGLGASSKDIANTKIGMAYCKVKF